MRVEPPLPRKEDYLAAVTDFQYQVDDRFERLEVQIRAESAETREYVDLKAHETRRHFDVVAEHIEELLKPLADGISANRQSIGRLVERLEPDSR